MYVMLDNEKESWVVSRLKLRHSHPYLAKKVVHYYEYRELTMHVKCVITENNEIGIRPNKTYLALANEIGGSAKLGFSEKDEINPNFFYAIDVDDSNKFRRALWVDARCRISYEYYGDVVSFDTTYRRNRHGLPFASFVGVNHHGKSTLLGCALLRSEEIPSFEWVFTQWVRCVETAPRGIITDQCKAMAGAIRKVLPDTIYRWYGELNEMMNHIVWNSPLTESFEADWAGFIKQFNLGHNIWLANLYANRRKWVPIFFKSEFWAGMSSTQRSESMHTFYGGYLHCKSGVDTVPSCYVLPQWSKNVIRKHTYIKSCHDMAQSDESNNLFRHLCSEFYNVAQEFLACDKEAAILRASLWDAKFKLTDYRASMCSTTIAASQNTMVT
ncbi:hypothetical protein Ahy_A08g039375 [Arachis hypogaea]|uniref:MULE transposase domain-containing protein n=1 Tax=Arachis hypogaea TaxID=3818 RepID=A0A445BW49_ARAHY|nr:hypothetical protein Ahy_A08g039375 [Arachis hypogaea]